MIFSIFGMILFSGLSNYLVEFPINDWLTWGAFTYPITFLITEITNYLYGAQKARQVVYSGYIVALILAFLWMNQRIAFASSTAFLIGQLMDIFVFSKLRKKAWWFSIGSASIFASLLDTLIFFSLAFAGTGLPWMTLGLGDFGIKLAMDILFLLPFRLFLITRPKEELMQVEFPTFNSSFEKNNGTPHTAN